MPTSLKNTGEKMKTFDIGYIEGVLVLSMQVGRRCGEGKVEKGIPFPSLSFLSETCQKRVYFAFLNIS